MNDASGDERIAQLEQALARSLEWLEEGEVEAARDELLRVAPASRPQSLITDQELEAAFARAEPETDQMLDADGVAQAAIQAADRALADESDQPLELGERFATASMAALLEQQGDERGALQIRAALGSASAPVSRDKPASSSRSHRDRVIGTLEQWLTNLRGGARA